ncbi:hypothetical protein [Nitrosophilus alvini]|uniref:hypothetical protein n=1 Tax=Nitrosophilus alvini TaxID=2714855 RepID=UPI0019092518|nr:hypothetical protein [Nitrosophilus alvini]
MKFLKSHLSLILPLFAILFSIQFYIMVEKAIEDYEKNLVKDYAIILVSKKEFSFNDIKDILPNAADLEEINPQDIIQRLKKGASQIDFESLKNFLPKFYNLHLSRYPSAKELEDIKKKLLSLPHVERVETFAKTHSKTYTLLVLLKQISKIFLALIAAISFLLIIKQMQVWHYEHSERMYIMALFGAPLWMRSGVLIRLAIVDALLSTAMVSAFFYYITNTDILRQFTEKTGVAIAKFNFANDAALLALIGLATALFSVIIVSTRQIKE